MGRINPDAYRNNKDAARIFQSQWRRQKLGGAGFKRIAWIWFLRGWRSNTPIDELIKAAFRKHAPEIAANVANNNALYRRLTRQGME
jgi:hypothetical protein